MIRVAAAVLFFAVVAAVQHTTLRLKTARRDLGAAVAGGSVVFGGGCAGSLKGGKWSKFVCSDPRNDLDI